VTRRLWLASYPKAGNTWVRFILADLACDGVAASEEVERLIPDAHRHGTPAPPPLFDDAMILKTHALPAALDLTGATGAIYVVRNPLDLFCSYLAYWKVPEQRKRRRRTEALAAFARNRGGSLWRRQGFGTLPENVASWLSPALPFPRLVLRYEDLTAAPRHEIARLCRFLGIERSSDALDRTIRRTSFDAMRATEEAERLAGRPGFFTTEGSNAVTPDWRFMNRGRVGGYRELLTDHEIDALATAFGPLMVALGYTLDTGRNLVVRELR